MRVDLLGVRGSTAAPGHDFVRYGGHTSCVAVTHDAAPFPTLVLDAGTGLSALTGFDGRAYDGAILLSHLHWDHVQGLPFFAAGERDDARVDLYLPAQGGVSGRDLLAQTLAPPAFPITPEGLRGAWGFHALDSGTWDIEGFTVRAVEVAHKGGRTFGYRLERDGVSFAYLPDHAPAAGTSPALLDALTGVDVLIHDAQFLGDERSVAADYGHATVEDAISLAVQCGVATLVLFHHSPSRTDDALDEIARWAPGCAPGTRVLVARQGDRIDVTPAAPHPSHVHDGEVVLTSGSQIRTR